MKKILMLFLTLALVLGLTSCFGEREQINSGDKEIIYVSLFSGGFGTVWMDTLLEEYNKTSEDYMFKRVNDNKYSVEDITDRVSTGINDASIYFADSSDIDELIAGKYLINLNGAYLNPKYVKLVIDILCDDINNIEVYFKGNMQPVLFTNSKGDEAIICPIKIN